MCECVYDAAERAIHCISNFLTLIMFHEKQNDVYLLSVPKFENRPSIAKKPKKNSKFNHNEFFTHTHKPQNLLI